MKMKAKLQSKRAMTLTEVLVALLVVSLVTIGIAAGTESFGQVYRQSVAVSESQLLSSTLMHAVTDELRYARNYEKMADGNVKLTSQNFGVDVCFGINKDGHVVMVKAGGNVDDAKKAIPLVSDGTYSGKTLKVKQKDAATPLVSLDGSLFTVDMVIDRGAGEELPLSFVVTPLNKK